MTISNNIHSQIDIDSKKESDKINTDKPTKKSILNINSNLEKKPQKPNDTHSILDQNPPLKILDIIESQSIETKKVVDNTISTDSDKIIYSPLNRETYKSVISDKVRQELFLYCLGESMIQRSFSLSTREVAKLLKSNQRKVSREILNLIQLNVLTLQESAKGVRPSKYSINVSLVAH